MLIATKPFHLAHSVGTRSVVAVVLQSVALLGVAVSYDFNRLFDFRKKHNTKSGAKSNRRSDRVQKKRIHQGVCGVAMVSSQIE